MSPKKRIRKNAVSFQHSNHEILGGKARIFRVPKSGDVWQFQMWISEEKKYLRKTLNPKDLDTAVQRAEPLYLETMNDVKTGRKIFGITLKELCDKYTDWREEGVALGNITKGRFVSIKSQLKHLIAYKGAKLKVSGLDRNSCYEYEIWRVTEKLDTKKYHQKRTSHVQSHDGIWVSVWLVTHRHFEFPQDGH